MREGQYDPTAKQPGNAGLLGQVHKVDQCSEQCAQERYSDARHIIARLINYHNRQSVWFSALERALPREMSPEAERGLYELAKAALGNIR